MITYADNRTNTPALKAALEKVLGDDAPIYFSALTNYFSGKIAKASFDAMVSPILGRYGKADFNRILINLIII
jgi:hypothetical protein